MNRPTDSAEARATRIDLLFRALDSRPRRDILGLLAQAERGEAAPCCGGGELCGCDISESTGLSAPTVSHHMKALAEAGLVAASKRGLWVHYRLVPGALDEVLEELASVIGRDAGQAG